LTLLKKLLTKDPNSRISASDARQDAYFNFDELDNEIIVEGCTSFMNFNRYGKIQQAIMRLYVEKIQSVKAQRAYK